jgi:hypothetical protein
MVWPKQNGRYWPCRAGSIRDTDDLGETMYSFLVLLPLTLISAAVGGIIMFSPQVAEYVGYISTYEAMHRGGGRLPLQVAVHIATYAVACFVLVATARTISAPLSPDRGVVQCRLQAALEAIFVAVPSVVIVALGSYSMVQAASPATAVREVVASAGAFSPPEALFWVAVAIGVVGLLTIVFLGRPREQRRFETALVAIIAGVPAALFIVLLLRLLAGGGSVSGLLALAAAVGVIGLAASVAAVVMVKRPLDLFRSSLRPLSVTLVDLLAGVILAASVGLVVSFMLRPVESAAFLGIFPVLFMASATVMLIVAAVFDKGSSPVAVVSTAISLMVVMHALDGLMPTREFRYRSEMPPGLQAKSGATLGIQEVEKARGIMDLRDAFLAWLEARRPAIEAYRNKGRAYPVFVVAAQGGGVYASYHSALSLARLYDSCPEFADHVFAISGVSGGALGSAVFTELLRSVPESMRTKPNIASEGCNPRPGAPNLEPQVKAFFTTDFLSPVVDSALVFDIPSLVVPWLRFGMDRAYALEYAFESAWRKTGSDKAAVADSKAPYGLQANFYGRWTPDGPAPALFLGTTGVNYGVPVVVSQIKWSQDPRLGLRRRRPAGGEDGLEDLLRRMRAQNERNRNSVIANILDFRPDLQLATSTAVALSARFPYVTPPANIKRSKDIEAPKGLFDKIRVLELLDGAYFDNSGGWVAIDILEDLERYLKARRGDGYKEFTNDIKFHLVRFTDRPAQRYGDAAEDEHFELVTPLVAFNSVRSARGAQLRGVSDLEKTAESFVYLSDPWFQPSLNWLLSKDTKANIELRSGAETKAESEVCCLVIAPPPPAMTAREAHTRRASPKEILLLAKWEEAKKLNDHPDIAGKGWKVVKFVPNNGLTFDKLRTLVKDGDSREAPAAAPTIASPN